MKYEIYFNVKGEKEKETVNSLPEAIKLVKDHGFKLPEWYEKQIYKRDEEHPDGGMVGKTIPGFEIVKIIE